MSESDIDKLLTEIYYDPLEGLMGINSLYKKAKKVIKTIKLKEKKKKCDFSYKIFSESKKKKKLKQQTFLCVNEIIRVKL